ncbi:MAG: DivIVA domain-containing protein [Bifidobacteriaceae bacterium]|jgi:DivIVA domain-containing protein|nr:DivIVA domain-containing protein [Bifidobacteriaceae bacterium]
MTILTLEDIKNVEFRPARLKEGYLADEVDKFIDDVIETFSKNQGAAPAPAQSSESPAPKPDELKAKDERIRILEAELNKSKEQQAAISEENKKLSNQLNEISETKSSTQKDAEILKADLIKAQAQNAQSSSDTLEEITKLTNEKEQLSEKLQQATAEVSSLNAKLTDYENQIQSSHAIAPDLEEEIRQLNEKYENQISENSKLNEQIDALKQSASDNGEKEKISELEAELNITQTKFNKIKSELEASISENAKNTEEIIRLRKTIQAYEEEPKTGATRAIMEAGINASSESEVDQVSSMLLLATKLRDEYITKARNESETKINEANIKANEIISDAKTKSDEVYAKLKSDREGYEKRINDLRVFEADYRSRISKQLNQILQDLKASDNSIE